MPPAKLHVLEITGQTSATDIGLILFIQPPVYPRKLCVSLWMEFAAERNAF